LAADWPDTPRSGAGAGRAAHRGDLGADGLRAGTAPAAASPAPAGAPPLRGCCCLAHTGVIGDHAGVPPRPAASYHWQPGGGQVQWSSDAAGGLEPAERAGSAKPELAAAPYRRPGAACPADPGRRSAHDGDAVQSHRIAPVIPMLWLATVEGLALLRAGWRRTAALALVLALAVLTFRDRSWLPGGGAFDPDLATRDALTAAMERALAVVPTEASVGATSNALIPLAD